MTFVYESKLLKTVTYDKDVGLAHEIEKVFQSPIKHRSANSNRTSPSPGASNQCCCACLEQLGGRLYTCSKCSASFHAICHSPPLPIITGNRDYSNWNCHRCEIEVQYDRRQRVKCNSDTQLKEDALNQSIVRFLMRLSGEGNAPSEKFDDFVNALKAINAREFSIEKLDVGECYYKLPFEEIYSRDDGIHAKPCFYCKKAQATRMIVCDFCQTSFCLDCISPPLTSLPNERFMCKLHIEPFLDSHLLSSKRVTDRIALWDEHSLLTKSDMYSVLKEFCKKIEEDAQHEQLASNRKRKHEKGQHSSAKLKSKRLMMPTTFDVDKSVKQAYAQAANSKAAVPEAENEQQVDTKANSDFAMAVEALMCIQSQSTSSIEESMSFYPDAFNERLPVFAALKILSGGDEFTAYNRQLVIPIQAEYATLGAFPHSSRHTIDLSPFTKCKRLTQTRALIFFDKAKLSFELVSANHYPGGHNYLESKFPKCKCVDFTCDVSSQEVCPSARSAVLWNGAIIQIGCLRLLFVGLGVF